MVRRYCNPTDQMDYLRRPNRSMPTQVSRENTRSFATNHHPSSPNHDSEDEKADNPPRRRIALACSRCRKRKIKCSGDTGNGCQNCKNAGTEPGTCQFLRVNSTTTYYSPSVSWPYSNPDSSVSTSAMARGGSNLGHYSLPSGGMLSSSGAGAGSNSNSNQFLRQTPLSNQSGAPYSTLPSRHIYSSSYGTSFGDDPFDPYTMQTGQYLMPLPDLQTSSSGFAAPDSSRHWTPIPNNRGLGNPSFDTESAIRCGSSTFPLMNSSGSSASSVVTDGSSAFPTMGSLATSLPLHPANVNRTLPNPTSKKVSRDSNGLVSQGTLNEPSVAINIPPNTSYRSSVSWDHDHVAAGGTQASASSTSVSAVGAADRTSSKPSASPRGSQDTANYGYIPLPPNSLTTNNVPPISDCLPANSAESTNSTDNYLGLSSTSFSAGLSGDTMISSQSTSGLYGYTMGSGSRNGSITDSMASEGTLVGGLPYNQLRQPQSQPTASFEASNRSSFESSRPTHRTSISSTNNARY